MSHDVYQRLADILDTLPNGFPRTKTGIEIQILRKLFRPEEAELFADLRLTPETPRQIATRTGRPLEGLDERLGSMWRRGLIHGIDFGYTRLYRMAPYVFGIYEFQVHRMDAELARLSEAYELSFGKRFFKVKPQIMQVVPVEKTLQPGQQALPYARVSEIIARGRAFALVACICRKQQRLLQKGCDKPLETCLQIATVPGVFYAPPGHRTITRQEAHQVLQDAEAAGLVHMTNNYQNGHYFICNCCGCCCAALRSINSGLRDAANFHYRAEIDAARCQTCGLCAQQRCQVNAIEAGPTYRIDPSKCIGCGLCATTCPAGAIRIIATPPGPEATPPDNENAWFAERGRRRGVDYSPYQ